jgi:hypothetical protein
MTKPHSPNDDDVFKALFLCIMDIRENGPSHLQLALRSRQLTIMLPTL